MAAQRPQPPPPPPPPPPPCPNVPLPLPPKKQPLISQSGWPRRLLHVTRMTSFLREGENTYDGVEAPRYNAMSYTWGRFTAQEPSLVIHGIDWPIPGVARSHFTVEAFEQAILRAARGQKSPECEWIWLDVACIPQGHEAESDDSKKLRNEEIGRQVEIFHGACEVFAWLSSLHAGSFLRYDSDRGPETIEEFLNKFHISASKMRNQDPSPWPSFYASEFISGLERDSQHLQHWTEMILAHPWFTSLWTLQEMALRRYAWILLDDGVLYVSGVAYNLHHFQQHMFFFMAMMEDPYTTRIMEAMKKVSDSAQDSKTNIYNNFMNRIKTLVQLYENRGLSLYAMSADFPHLTYSAAKQRDATHLTDRILGIMQIYAIRCNPDPPGVDQKAQLQHLEDEFGEHLVAKYPLLSQLFIHTSVEDPPRRSWLITQGCSANDDYWLQFTDTFREVGNLFETLATVRSPDKLNVYLHFRGKAWDLDSFVHASSPNSDLPDSDKNLLFRPASRQLNSSRYQGLILDYHVSAAALGRLIHFFPSHEAMEDAVRQLYDKYDLKVPHEKGSKLVRPSSSIKVAPLGWNLPAGRIAPYVRFVGLVLARSTKQSSPLTRQTTGESQPISASAFTWERLGLMRWIESYSYKNTRRHYHLPEPHEFEAIVA